MDGVDGMGPPSVVIRDAELEELDQVAGVIASAYQEYAALMPPDAWAMYLENIRDVRSRLEESDLIVVLQKGAIVGAATFYPRHKRRTSLAWPSDWTAIRLVAVSPKGRGQGLARMLVEECIRRSRKEAASAVGLHTTPLMTVAAAMYERMGFVRVPEFDFHPRPEMTVMAYKLLLS